MLTIESNAQPALLALNASENLYEVIDGVIEEKPTMGALQLFIANFLLVKIGSFALNQQLGHGLMEVLFDLSPHVKRKRRPDMAFVSASRWPMNKPVPDTDGLKCIPNLAVEIICASNTWEEIREKTREYFRAGVERVWVVSAKQREVHIYDSPTDVRILSDDGELTDALLPGFSLPISELFAMAEITTDEAVEQ